MVCGLALVACGPVVDVGVETDSSATDDPTTGTTATTSTTGTTGPTSTTSLDTSVTVSVSTTVEPTTDDPPPPPDDGYCTPACEIPIDCCRGELTCEKGLGTYPYNYGCENGTCTFGGCTGDDDCTFGGALEGYICVEDDGYAGCWPSCDTDQDCVDQFLTGWVCNGTYCEQPPCASDEDCEPDMKCSAEYGTCFYPCTDETCSGGNGHCDADSGLCVCSSDDECNEGFGCQPYP